MKYALDRIDVPKFYTPISSENYHKVKSGQVLTESSDHGKEGWVAVGYVSKQTPFGQGIYMGFEKNELREATSQEIIASLLKVHPFGIDFKPSCQEALDASFHLVMSTSFSNWTNDKQRGIPVINFSRQEILDYRNSVMANHNKIIKDWRYITEKQRDIIKQIALHQPLTLKE
jgi:hypothetical protein